MTRTRLHTVTVSIVRSMIAASAFGCSRAPTTSTAGTSSATTIASATPTGAVALPNSTSTTPSGASAKGSVAWTIARLPVALARASSEIGGATPHVADDAFDGDPFDGWCAPKLGKDAWVEGEFATPQRLRRVRVVSGLLDRMGGGAKSAASHGKVDLAHVQLDAGTPLAATIDPKTGDAIVDLGDGIVAKRLRVFVDAATKGKTQDDACLSEVEAWGDASALGAPAGFAAKLYGADLDAAIAALPGAPHANFVDLVAALGFSEGVRHDVAFYSAIGGTRRVLDLDADDGLESLVDVGFAQRVADGRYVVERHALAVVDDDAHDHVVLGRRWVFAQQCFVPPDNGSADAGAGVSSEDGGDAGAPMDFATLAPLVLVAPHAVHAPPVRDLVVRSTALDTCGDRESGRDAAMVLTVERGMLETVASWQTPWTNPVDSTTPITTTAVFTPSLDLECSAGAACALAYRDASAAVQRWIFEPKSFLYR